MQGNSITVWLWACLVAFMLRVVGQALTYWREFSFLPPFDAWYSGAISYHFLVIWQLTIIILMVWFTFRFSKGLVKPRRSLGTVLQTIGIIYFGIMFVRLVISLFGLSDHIWFNRPIPSFFHLVLASYLFFAGRYHSIKSGLQGS